MEASNSCLKPGDSCIMVGLTSAAGMLLNGQQCTIMGWESSSGRFLVRLREDDPKSAWKKLLHANLQQVPSRTGEDTQADDMNITMNIEQKDGMLAVSFYNVAGDEVIEQREFDEHDCVDKLQFYIREVLERTQVYIFDSIGSLVDGGIPIARFAHLTARCPATVLYQHNRIFPCGGDDIITAEANSGLKLLNCFTCEIWVKPLCGWEPASRDGSNSGGGYARVLGKGRSPYRNYGIWIDKNCRPLAQIFPVSDRQVNAFGPGPLPFEKWSHVACRFVKGQSLDLFINGEMVACSRVSDSLTPSTSDDCLTLGRSDEPNFDNTGFVGLLYGAKVHCVAFEDSEIQAAATLNIPVEALPDEPQCAASEEALPDDPQCAAPEEPVPERSVPPAPVKEPSAVNSLTPTASARGEDSSAASLSTPLVSRKGQRASTLMIAGTVGAGIVFAIWFSAKLRGQHFK